MSFNRNNNPYRDNMNRQVLLKLFYEFVGKGAMYTLKDEDWRGSKSLYKLYMECEDVTEWDFANKYLDGYNHWQRLCKCSWFKPYVERWRKELELMLKARALKNIQDIAQNDGKDSLAANKFLIEKGYSNTPKEVGKRGRPSKEEIAREAERMAHDSRQAEQDFERLFGSVEDTSDPIVANEKQERLN